jgi:hypothetical protein
LRKASFRRVRGALRFPDGAFCVSAACGVPPKSAWSANSRPPSLPSKHDTCGGSTARLPRVPNELPVAITIAP